MSNEKRNIAPKVRFPEFIDTDSWDIRPLGKVANNLDSKRVPITSTERIKGEIPYYGASGIIDYVQDFIFNDDLLLISEDGANLVARTYPIAFSISGKSWVNNHAHVLKFENWYTQALVENYLNSISLEAFLTGMAQPKLNRAKLDIIPIPFPRKPEQEKVANLITSLNDLIHGEKEKLDGLKDHKTGLLQQLFPTEGETVPQLRFPEFEDDGEWVETKIGKEFSSFSGGTPTTTNKEYYGGNIPFIRSAEINKDSTELYLTDKGLSNSSAKLVKKGDVLVALYGANSGDVAISKLGGAINQAILCLSSERSNDFLYHYLTYNKKYIIATYLQGGQGNLSGEIVKSIVLMLPKPEEQKKIADCLSFVDEMIESQSSKIHELQKHKKGLMQQLFPSVNEGQE